MTTNTQLHIPWVVASADFILREFFTSHPCKHRISYTETMHKLARCVHKPIQHMICTYQRHCLQENRSCRAGKTPWQRAEYQAMKRPVAWASGARARRYEVSRLPVIWAFENQIDKSRLQGYEDTRYPVVWTSEKQIDRRDMSIPRRISIINLKGGTGKSSLLIVTNIQYIRQELSYRWTNFRGIPRVTGIVSSR